MGGSEYGGLGGGKSPCVLQKRAQFLLSEDPWIQVVLCMDVHVLTVGYEGSLDILAGLVRVKHGSIPKGRLRRTSQKRDQEKCDGLAGNEA